MHGSVSPRRVPMIYILAVFLPPLGLLLNGQPISAAFNLAMIVPCILLGLLFPVLFFVPSAHAVISVYSKREDRRHRELVDAIERHGPPPGWPGRP
jgi:hypothetical protein